MLKFLPGQMVATVAALEEVERSGDNLLLFLQRHLGGDWGDIHPDDRGINEQALKDGSRLLSVYTLANGSKVWIITEGEDDRGRRQATTVLLPSDY